MEVDAHIRQAEDKQRRIQSFAFLISICVCVLLSLGFVARRSGGSGQSCEIELDERVNPNIASPASLVRLPGIGPGRAEAIVAYRDEFGGQEGSMLAFRDCNDLQKVKGIGPKTVQNISEWLTFE